MLKGMIAIVRGIVDTARVADGNEGVTSTDHVPDWMAVRGVTAYWMANAGPGCFLGWQSLACPGGVIV
jgi:hypothetical protein